jgi:MFS family permease
MERVLENDAERAPAGGGVRKAFSVGILFFLYAFAYLDRQFLNLLIDPIREGLDLSDLQIGVLTGFAFTLFYGISGLPMGSVVDRYSRKGVIFGGLLVWSTCSCLCGLARRFSDMLFARFGVGAGESVLLPAAYSLLADLFPKERLGGVLGIFTAGAAVGGGASLILGGLLFSWATAHGVVHVPIVGALQPWQQVLVISGLPGLATAWMVFLIPRVDRGVERARKANAKGFAEAWRFMRQHSRFFLCHAGGFTLMNIAAVGYLVWSPTFLHRHFGWSLKDIGISFGVFSMVCGILGSIGSGALADLLYKRGALDAHMRIYTWGSLVLAACGIVAALAPNALVFFVAVVPAMMIKTFAGNAAGALQIVAPPELRGKISAIYLAVFTIVGGGLGPLVIATLTDHLFHDPAKVGHSMALGYGVLLPLASAVLWLGLPAMRSMQAADRAAEHHAAGSGLEALTP